MQFGIDSVETVPDKRPPRSGRGRLKAPQQLAPTGHQDPSDRPSPCCIITGNRQ
jgi:hypothetical protein